MSQHADILKHEIAKGISRGNSVETILEDISGILSVMEYPEEWCERQTVKVHAHQTATWMKTQKDGLYGVSHEKLDAFIKEVWESIPF